MEEADTLHRWGRALLAAGAPDRANQKFDAAIEIYRRYGAGERWIERVQEGRRHVRGKDGTVEDQPASFSSPAENIFRKQGEYWITAYQDGSANLRERGGMRFIALLLGRPGEKISAVEMFAAVAADAGTSPQHDGLSGAVDLGDAGEKFDARALSEYRRRLTELESEIDVAEAPTTPTPPRAPAPRGRVFHRKSRPGLDFTAYGEPLPIANAREST